MKISSSTAIKITISDYDGLDSVSVYLEDFGPGWGKVVITCLDQSWTHVWGCMGDPKKSILQWLIKIDTDYLTKCLFKGQEWEPDFYAFENKLKKNLIRMRRKGVILKWQAREYWNTLRVIIWGKLGDIHYLDSEADVLLLLAGEDWRVDVPSKRSPGWDYLYRIMGVIKEGLKIYESQQPAAILPNVG